MRPWQRKLVGWMFVLGASMFLGVMLQNAWEAHQARRWPTTPGRITSVEIAHEVMHDRAGRAIHTWTPEITYTYVVRGQVYSSNEITAYAPSFDTKAPAVALTRRFPVGATVPVHYDPAGLDAVLLLGAPYRHVVKETLIALLVLVLGLGALLYPWLRWLHPKAPAGPGDEAAGGGGAPSPS